MEQLFQNQGAILSKGFDEVMQNIYFFKKIKNLINQIILKI